jgi:serine/threonine protein kinase
MVDLVMVEGREKIITKMIDFGEAKYYIQEAAVRTGTRGYMSPEIYFGTNCYSEACDYWSLGLTFYELFEGVKTEKRDERSLCCPFK